MPLIVGFSMLVDDAAVGEEHDAVGVAGGTGIVGDHDDRLPEAFDRGASQLEELGGRSRVEVAGRLVGEDQLGPGHHRPGGGDALLLAARQLRGPVSQSVGDAEAASRACAAMPASGRRPARANGSVMFSSAVSVGTRLNAWKTNPTRSRRSKVSCLSLSVVKSVSPMNTAPEVRRVETGEAVQQRRLAGARRAHDGGETSGLEADGDSVQGADFGGARGRTPSRHRQRGRQCWSLAAPNSEQRSS